MPQRTEWPACHVTAALEHHDGLMVTSSASRLSGTKRVGLRAASIGVGPSADDPDGTDRWKTWSPWTGRLEFARALAPRSQKDRGRWTCSCPTCRGAELGEFWRCTRDHLEGLAPAAPQRFVGHVSPPTTAVHTSDAETGAKPRSLPCGAPAITRVARVVRCARTSIKNAGDASVSLRSAASRTSASSTSASTRYRRASTSDFRPCPSCRTRSRGRRLAVSL